MIVLLSVSAIVIFGPPNVLREIGLLQLKTLHPMVIGVVFLISAAFTLTYFAEWLTAWVKRIVFRVVRRKYLRDLTVEEKRMLASYIQAKSKSQFFALSNGVAIGLKNAGIIFVASNSGSQSWGEDVFPFNMHDWAWKEIQKNPAIISV